MNRVNLMEENYPKIYLYKRIVQAKLFIDTHLSDDIDLDNIADEAYFSKFHFIRLFKTIYGKTPHQYLTRVRIESAKELLQKDTSVTETCFSVGFESITSFTALSENTQSCVHLNINSNLKSAERKLYGLPCNSFQIVLLNKKAGQRIAIFKKCIEESLLTFATHKIFTQ